MQKSEVYTHVAVYSDKILFRGVDRNTGERFSEQRQFSPTIFVTSKEDTKHKTLFGDSVKPFSPGGMKDTKEFIDKYMGVSGFDVHGNDNWKLQYISENFPGEIDWSIDQIKIAYMDIETECEYGFPNTSDPQEKINLITVKYVHGKKKYTHTFGVGVFDIDGVICHQFETEKEMLEAFVSHWREEEPDIVTGWNIRFFDLPYLANRIKRVFNLTMMKNLSPWNITINKTIHVMGRDQSAIELVGISSTDFLELYKKYTTTNQESYKLDHIAFVELGEKKLDYSEYDSIADFYRNDFQKFAEYNVKDVELVERLNEKMQLIELHCSMAYMAKINFEDVFSQVRMWDAIIYNHLRDKNIVIPLAKREKDDSTLIGAYVKEPIVGFHEWVVSFDLNSLYPHLIMQYNVSPETKIESTEEDRFGIGVDNILKNSPELYWKPCHEKLKEFASNDYSIAANGVCYRKDKQGFLPELMQKMYSDRKKYKKLMIEAQKELEDLPNKNMPSLGRAGYTNKLKVEEQRNHLKQMALKIALNSAYGALGNKYFRYYDIDLAEAITMSGQLSIQWIGNHLNDFLNKTFSTDNFDYVVASDTDSVYLRLGKVVEKFCSNKTKEETINYLDKVCKEIMQPFINQKYEELAKMMNAYDNKMVMEREVIADKGIWTAKKRYILQVHDSEGVRYETPKLKIMGIETTRSSTPQVVRDKLKECIKLILTTDEKTVINFIEEFRDRFISLPAEDVAFPRGVNGLERYRDVKNIYSKGTPIAVKGALIYNYMIQKKNLDRKYEAIREGDKVKFLMLKVPNPTPEKVLAFTSNLPKEFELEKYIDYDTQFEKAFIDPIKTILETVGWQHERTATLEDLFA